MKCRKNAAVVFFQDSHSGVFTVSPGTVLTDSICKRWLQFSALPALNCNAHTAMQNRFAMGGVPPQYQYLPVTTHALS